MIGAGAIVFVGAAAEFGEGHGEDLVVELAFLEIFLKGGESFGELGKKSGMGAFLVAVGVETAEGCKINAGFHATRDKRGDRGEGLGELRIGVGD